ncbi:MAG: hypothetical protein H7Y27_15110, partial [Gemmatimonadaceae bacterium]|nr:hypothetical protein [Chitinophagaceae bacterium]
MLKKAIPIFVLSAAGIAIASYIFSGRSQKPGKPNAISVRTMGDGESEEEEDRTMYVKERTMYDFMALRNPFTGKIPSNIFQNELKEAILIPRRNVEAGSVGMYTNNSYSPAEPNNQGGRTRAIAFDKRF